MSDATNPPIAKAADALAAGTIVGSIVGWLPTALTIISGILWIIWYGIQIYESRTFKNVDRWLRRTFRR